jgi:GT2 family glycosyltransferase
MKNKYTKGLTSIIMPTWIPRSDKKKYISWTLKSLAQKTDSPFEMIIFNNETNSDSEKFLNSFKIRFDKNKSCKDFRVLTHTQNQGWTGGLQLGTEDAKGEYVCFSNDDLVYERHWLSKMLKHFRGDIAAVGPTSNFVSGLQDVKFCKRGEYEEKVNYLIGFCMLFKRKALDDIVGKGTAEIYYVDPRFYPGGSEEFDICFRLAQRGHDMVIAKDVFIHHFGNRTLHHFKEFDKMRPMNFFQPRLDKLTQKHGEDTMKVVEFQHSPKFAVGIPTVGHNDSLFLSNYPWFLQSSWSKFGFNNILPIVSPRNVVHLGRAEIVKKAIMYGVEYLMFLDDDMIIPENTLIKLASHKKDFVSALAYKRNEPYFPCIFTGKDSTGAWLPDTRLRQGLVEVDVTGLSCCLIKMNLLKKMIKAKEKQIFKRGGLFYFTRFGEDFNFCEELKKMGVKIYADTDLIVDHLGRRLKVNDQTYLSYTQQQEAIKQARIKNQK